MRHLLPALLLLTLLSSCQKDPVITPDGNGAVSEGPSVKQETFRVPAGWPAPKYTFEDNPFSPNIVALGLELFNEPILSRDNTITCAFCHQPEAAFANADHITSHGIGGLLGPRNSPGLFNLAWHDKLMWDGGVHNLEAQLVAPIQNPVEMDLPIDEAVSRLANSPKYQEAFKKAFGSEGVTLKRLGQAMGQFMAVLISDNSKWDQVQQGKAGFTPSESAGEAIFKQNCQTCHAPPLFSTFGFASNGIRPIASRPDVGRFLITREETDSFKFKIPSLRNIGITGPYFHDGRARNLEAVLNHYADSLVQKDMPHTDPRLKGGIPLTGEQRVNLIAFLKTLDDETFIRNRAFRLQR